MKSIRSGLLFEVCLLARGLQPHWLTLESVMELLTFLPRWQGLPGLSRSPWTVHLALYRTEAIHLDTVNDFVERNRARATTPQRGVVRE